jgi:WD40 repeat protein
VLSLTILAELPLKARRCGMGEGCSRCPVLGLTRALRLSPVLRARRHSDKTHSVKLLRSFFFFFFFFFFFWFFSSSPKGFFAWEAMDGLSERCLFPGINVPGNASSLNLSFQRLVAHGAGSSVVVSDASNVDGDPLPVVATLDGHPGIVCCSRWSQRPLDNNLDNPYKLVLATGDDKGSVMIWSVLEGLAELHLTDTPAGAVLDMCWHPENYSLLLTLRERNVIALWDTSGGVCLWRCVVKNLEDLTFASFNASPFSLPLRDVFFASRKGSIYWLSDVEAGSSTELVLKYKIQGPDPKSSFCGMQMYPAVPGCVLFVLSKEVLVFDMAMQHAVGGFVVERGLSALLTVSASLRHPGVVWALHEDGRVSLWRAQGPSFLSFSLVGSSTQLRFAKTRRQEAVPLVAIQARDNLVEAAGLSCMAMDRMGSLFSWALEGTNLEVEEMRHGLCSNVSSYALHPVAGARQVALGTQQGTLVIADAISRRILREFLIENGQVIRGVQWFGREHVLLFVVQEMQADLVYMNSVLKVEVASGSVRPLLQNKRAEPTHIRSIKLSPSGRFMLVLRRDRPVELYDVNGATALHLGNIKPYIQVNALAWRVPSPEDLVATDEFAAATVDNMVRTFRVESGRLVVVRQQDALTVYPISCISWRGEHLVTGDSSGGLSLFDWKRKVCWTVNLRGAAIADLHLNRSNSTVLVVFASGAVCIYDVSVKRQVNESTLLSVRNLRVQDAGWWLECPVLLCSDGCLRVMDGMLGSCNTPLVVASMVSLSTPFLLETRLALTLKVKMLLAMGESSDSVLSTPSRLAARLASCSNYGERALLVAKFFGDFWEETVWQLVLSLDKSAQKEAVAVVASAAESSSAVKAEKFAFLRQSSLLSATASAPARQSTKTGPLPSLFGLVRTEAEVREQFEAQSSALERKRNIGDATTQHLAARRFIWSGDAHAAIAVLTNSDPDSPSFQTDSLLACLVAASAGPDYFERTTKSAATGLIARGDVDLGVQLLVLVGRVRLRLFVCLFVCF